jgi:hypothetical protein
MVLNKDVNPEDEWEVVSDEGTLDQVNPSSEAGDVMEAATVEVANEAAVSNEEQADAMQCDSLDGAEEQQEQLEVAQSKSGESLVSMEEEQHVVEPTKKMPDEESAEAAAKDEQEPLLTPESITNESIPEAPSAPSSQEQRQSTKRASLPGWLSGSLNKIGEVIKEADAKHHIQQKARNSVKAVGDSITKIGDSIQKEASTAKAALDRESVRITKTVQEKADQVEWHKKTKAVEVKAMEAAAAVDEAAKKLGESVKTTAVQAGEKVKTTACAAGEKVKTLNKEGKVTELFAAAAVIGGAILVARGKTGAGAAMMATGGAAYAAGEATKEARRFDEGLNEDLHMD